MPVVKFKIKRLQQALRLSLNELEDLLFRLKCETEVDENGYIYIELNPDRPDMYSLEGIVRSARGLLGKERGFNLPEVFKSNIVIKADFSESRPVVAGVVIEGLNLDEDQIEELVQFQEKLHDTIGRRRRKVAIGIHDMDKLPSKLILYKEIDIDKELMRPLHINKVMTIREVLLTTEQGKKYGEISLHGSKHPALIAGGKIISLPPVINSDTTKIEQGTKNLFIDVTGTDSDVVLTVLDIIACNLSYFGGKLGKIDVIYPDKKIETPVLRTKKLNASTKELHKIIGLNLEPSLIVDFIEKARYRASYKNSDLLEVIVPPFRADVFGISDLAEDISMMIGYENLGTKRNPIILRGSLSKLTLLRRKIRDILIGLGFTEIVQLTLISQKIIHALKIEKEALKLSNPVQVEHSVIRPALVTTLLDFLRENQHKEKPIKVFEIGKIAFKRNKDIVEEEALGMAIMDSSISYEDIQAPVYSLLRTLSLKYDVKPLDLPYLLKGRSALVLIDGVEIGWLGEISPEVLERLEIEYPIAIAEINLSVLSGEGNYRIQGL